jgi:protoheme IX farnesyltransferase
VVCVDNASDRILYGRASNAFNQVIEKDLDALMDRTKTVQFLGRMSTFQHWLLRAYFIVGITLLYMINPTNVWCDLYFLHQHTPLKTVTSLSVFGAFPSYSVYVRLGCCNRRFWDRSWNIILIQFFWQFHFWAIGWFLYEDYEKQAFFMLPTGKRQGYRFAGYFV